MPKYATAGQLKRILANVPDETPILVPHPDHSYRHAVVQVATALYDDCWHCWSEDHGEDATPEQEFGTRTKVVIVT